MLRGALSRYDAIISTLGKKATINHRLVTKLLQNHDLTPAQADSILDITKKAYCDNYHVYIAYLGYYGGRGKPEDLVQKYDVIKHCVPENKHSAGFHTFALRAYHELGDMPNMLRCAEVLYKCGEICLTNSEIESLLLHVARTEVGKFEAWWGRLRLNTPLRVTSYNELITAFSQPPSPKFGFAYDVFSTMFCMKVRPNSETFAIAAGMYARARDSRGYRTLLNTMSTCGEPITRSVLLAVMDLYVVYGDVDSCEKAFAHLRERGEATSVAFDQMITLYSNAGDMQKVHDIWAMMKQQGIEPSTNTYNLIIAAHAKLGRSAECTQFFEAMKADKLAPNLGTFAGVLSAYVMQRNFHSTRKYYDEMTQAMPIMDGVGAILQYCSMKSELKLKVY